MMFLPYIIFTLKKRKLFRRFSVFFTQKSLFGFDSKQIS